MTATSDAIASLVQREFDRLPTKRKPVVRDNGLHEWVPLSGIVAEEKNGRLTCLALATGMKCLPSSKLPQAKGNVLHDWHAEVLVIRAFNCFVLDECQALANGSKNSSEFIRCRDSTVLTPISGSAEIHDGDVNWHGQPYSWREDVRLHMYCSEAPCGDASMELTMASQEDATPWTIPTASNQESLPFPSSKAPGSSSLEPDALLLGRGYFSQLGIVRRKPSRGDAPSTLSKSCSDKLSLHQCTSLLSSTTSLLVSPEHAYISTLILPISQYSASGCRRAFSDGQDEDQTDKGVIAQKARMAPLATQNNSWKPGGGYTFHPFTIKTTDLEFAFSRRCALTPLTPPTSPESSMPKPKIAPSNLSVAYTASNREETTLNGVLQGHKAAQATPRGASFASRRRIWGLAVEVASLLGHSSRSPSPSSYPHSSPHPSAFPSSSSSPNKFQRIQNIQQALGIPLSPSTSTSTSTSTSQCKEATPKTETETETEEAIPTTKTYHDLKSTLLLEPRRRAKQAARQLALKGWVRNIGDEDFALAV